MTVVNFKAWPVKPIDANVRLEEKQYFPLAKIAVLAQQVLWS